MLLDKILREQVRAHLAAFPVRRLAVGTQRAAAVALALIEEGEGAALPGMPAHTEWSQSAAVLLTRRADRLSSHGGQWALPGGRIDPGDTREAALARAQACWAAAGERAAKAGVVYCVEPLTAEATPLVNNLAEAAQLVAAIGNPALRSMLDCCSAGKMEKETLPELVARWLPQGLIAHVQVNDRNRRGPGQGDDSFAPLLAALVRHGYSGDIAVEPFDYMPDGPGSAARAVGYLRGVLEGVAARG